MEQDTLPPLKAEPKSFIVPNHGEVPVTCSKCMNPDFAVHVKLLGPNTARISELICTKCLAATKMEGGPIIDRRGKVYTKKVRRYLNDKEDVK